MSTAGLPALLPGGDPGDPEDSPPSDDGSVSEGSGILWRRADGQLRVLVHLDGSPADAEETPVGRIVEWLDQRLPWWDDHLVLVAAGLFVLLLGVLVALL
jgi:hypothetical protein